MASNRIKGITIELGGDTTKLVSALANVDKAISSTQTNIRDLDKALKLDPGNVALLKDKQQELGVEIQNTESKLQMEKQALEQMKNTEGFDKNSEAARNLQTQIDLDEAALKRLQQEAKEAGNIIGTSFDQAGQKISEVGEKIKGVGDKISSVGSELTAKVTTPIVGALGAAVKTTADFDEQMSKVQAISGATGEEFDQLREKAREMGASTKYSASEAGEAFEYMGMAGWKAEQMVEGIPAILNLAAASGEELGTTSDIVTDALTAFGLKAEDAGRFADVLAAASTNANTNVAMMGESFKYVAPVAGSLGYSVEDVAVALGLMANSGIKADMAGTSLRNMFQRMAKPTKESSEAMQRLGLSLYDSEGNMYSFGQIMDQMRDSFKEINMSTEDYDRALDELDQQLADGTLTQSKYDAALEELNLQAFGAEGAEKARAAAMLGGTRAMSGLLAIVNTSEEDYKALNDAIYQSSDAFAKLADGSVVPLNEALESGQEILETYNGQAEAMAATMQDNLTGDITVLKSMLEELAISFGDLLMPLMREAVGKIQELVDYLNSLDESQKEQILRIAAVVAAIGPALIVVGKVVSAVGTIVSGIGSLASLIGTTLIPAITAISAPVLAVVAVIAALAAGFVYLYNTNEEFRNKVTELVETIKSHFQDMIDKIKPALSELFESVKELVSAVLKAFDAFMQKVKPVFEFIATGIAGVVNGVLNAMTPIVNAVNSIIKTITSVVKAMFALVTGDFDGFSQNMKNALKNLLDVIKNLLEAKLQFFKGIFETFGSDLGTKAMQWGIDMIESLIDGIKSMIDRVGDAISSVADVIASFIHFSEPDKGPLANFHTYMPDMMKEMISGINKGIPQLQNAMNNVAGTLVPGNYAAAGNNVTATNTVTITVNAGNMNPTELANKLTDVIQNNINAQIYRQGAAWA